MDSMIQVRYLFTN